MRNFMAEVMHEWKKWISEKPAQKAVPLILTILYWVVISKVGRLGTDHLIVLVPAILYYSGPRIRPIYEFLLPLFLTMIIYDSQRYYADYIRGPVHVREPFDFDLRFFGIEVSGVRLTPNQWFQLNTHPVVDVITGFFYIAFVPIFVGFALYFRFIYSRVKPAIVNSSKNILWAFFWLNMIGYSTYYWYAASPPWYVEKYGFGPARLDIPGSAAGCERFDIALGTNVFNEWYGRTADVHGAIPSLHIAYPFLIFLYALWFRKLRVSTLIFFLCVSFSAVYLNHHYIIDLLWGMAYTIGIMAIMVWKFKKSGRVPCRNQSVRSLGQSLLSR